MTEEREKEGMRGQYQASNWWLAARADRDGDAAAQRTRASSSVAPSHSDVGYPSRAASLSSRFLADGLEEGRLRALRKVSLNKIN